MKTQNNRMDAMRVMRIAAIAGVSLALWACSDSAESDFVVLSEAERQEAATAFLDNEIGDQSVLTREEQEAELAWFMEASKPFQGMEISVVSETTRYSSWAFAPG